MKALGRACLLLSLVGAHAGLAQTLREQNDILFRDLQQVHRLTPEQLANVRRIFEASGFVGQGNPRVSRHPVTPAQCEAELARRGISYADPRFERICGAPYMAPLYDPKAQQPEDAKVCIDQFEFPDIPCAYPVVWVRARAAAQICEAVGKRLCDAHEWEGACQGELGPPDYRFDQALGLPANAAIARLRILHNQAHEADKRWSYGTAYQRGVCAAASEKTPGCAGGGWDKCGSNTYPSGYFPFCRSPLGVYDLNGNAAEHMNLPLDASQMTSRGSKELGYTEMKGSWFIFDMYRAHEDWCRWRAPYWHGSRVLDANSHENYHLGFRCCKSLQE
jgi:formylglycine-generating enzyme required for sulfatase activity